MKKMTGDSCVFADDGIAFLHRLDGAERDVAKVADGGGDDGEQCLEDERIEKRRG